MPRLMLCPSSVRRPRMVSLPGKSPDTTRSSSIASPFSKYVVRESPTISPTSSCINGLQVGHIPSAERKFDQLSFGAVESIDLTGEAALPSSSTTESYEPHPQERESYAISKLPESRRKKRKSSACTPDSLELSQSPSEDGTQNSSSFSRKSRATRPAASSRPSPFRDMKLSERTIVNKDWDDSSSDGWLDVDTLFPDAEFEASPLSSKSKLRGIRDKETTGQSNLEPSSGSDARTPADFAKFGTPSPLHTSASVTLTKGSSIQQEDNSFTNYITSDSEAVAQLITNLKEKLHNNAEFIYQQAIEGRPAPDVIAANQDLVSQIKSLETLQMSRIAYHNCVTRKENLKRRLVLAISEGSDPTSMPELALSQDLEAKMRGIEIQIRELLRMEILVGPCKPDMEHLPN